MIPPVLRMRDFADPQTSSLDTKPQAQRAIRAIQPHPRRRVDLDFSGVSGISLEFAAEFMRLAQRQLPDVWLVPKHYDQGSRKLIGPLLSHLKRQREQEWIDGCERFSTGIDPRQTGRKAGVDPNQTA